ncbi:MAG TPA: serine/threonine-protein kinase [Candidatus Wunengus sp. YC63]|uniref:serine/threonine-protein kinase n=1 Tax=Candidatus Wunengus sp. YC63 TaxID=3367699 RepID=UPI004029E197
MLPQKIRDRYITERWLGSGAYGDVYEMWDTLLEKSFAVKVIDIRHTNKESVLREARCLMDLHHPYIIRFHTCEVYEDNLLIFTELLKGIPLYEHIQKNHGNMVKSFHHYAVKILNAVKYIHDHGIVHGDLKTGNILLTGSDEVKIIDFGLASYVFKAEFHGGTPSYTAPEIWKGGACSIQSDIFSIGCIFYEMIMGRQLFTGKTVEEIKNKILNEYLIRLTNKSTQVTRHILSTVTKSLVKNPAERMQSCAQYLEELLRQSEKHDVYGKKNILYVYHPKIKPPESMDTEKQDNVKKALSILPGQLEQQGEQKQNVFMLSCVCRCLKTRGEAFFRSEIAPRLDRHMLIAMLNPKGIRSNELRAVLAKIAMETILKSKEFDKELVPMLISNILSGYVLGKHSAYLLAKRVENAEEILLQLLQRDNDLILRNVIHGVMALTPTERLIAAMRDVYQRRSAWYIQEACSQYFQQVEKKNSHPE